MEELEADSHYQCYEGAVGKLFEVEHRYSSIFSYFLVGQEKLGKVRKAVSNVLRELSAEDRSLLAQMEMERGSVIEPRIYLSVIPVPCLRFPGYCSSALILERFEQDARFDRFVDANGIEEHVVYILATRLSQLLTNSKIIRDYDYAQALRIGNNRLMSQLGRVKHPLGSRLGACWSDVDQYTTEKSDRLNRRVADGYVRALHGDLSWTNMYYVDQSFYFLDPCVAAPDMYYIDVTCQVADILVEFLVRGFEHGAGKLLESLEHSSPGIMSRELLKYYIRRRALIRSSIHALSGGNVADRYLEVYEKYREPR